MLRNRGITFKLVFFILTSCVVIFALIFGRSYLVSRRIITTNIENNAKNLAELTVNKIEVVLRAVEKVPKNFARFRVGEDVERAPDTIKDLLRSVIKNNTDIYGTTIAYEPYAFDEGSLYFAPYFCKSASDKEIKFKYLGDDRYVYFYWDWFQIPKVLGRPIWTEPYYDKGGGDFIMTTYSVPFYDDDDKFMGVMTADICLTWLQNLISSIKIGETGYAFMISGNGTFVTHPDEKLIMNDTIFSMAEAVQDPRMRGIGKDMIKGNSGFVPFRSIVTGKECWMAYAPVPSSGWSLGVLFPKEELMADINRLNRTVFILGILGFLVLFAIIVVISGSITKPLRILASKTRDIARGDLDFELTPVRSGDEVGRLAAAFIYMREALKRYIKDLTDTTAKKERMESELNIAHNIQMSIVPKTFPAFPDNTEFDIYAVLDPAREVGGDFYDFFFIDDDHLFFALGDVSSKGVPAALFMAVVKTLLKATAMETGDPDEIMEKVNKEAAKNTSAMFVTIFCGVLNIRTGEICYANAGHNPPLIIRKGEGVEFLRPDGGIAVGAFDGAVYKKEEIILGPEDTIYIYSDGITEAFNGKQEMFSEERLREHVTAHRQDDIRELVDSTLRSVRSFAAGEPQSDDITVMALRFFHAGKKREGSVGKARTLTLKNDRSEVQKLSHAVNEFGKENELSGRIINQVNMAIEEIVINIIAYGYRDKKEHRIDVHMRVEDDDLLLMIEDDGRPFDPTVVPTPDINKPIEEREIGGLGVHLVRSLMEELEYRREKGKNVLIMRKKLRNSKGRSGKERRKK